MITGVVTPDSEAIIHLQVRGQQGQETEVEALIDTGFNRFLTLPSAVITQLNLATEGISRTTLADGSDVEMHVYRAIVLWDQEDRDISVLESEGEIAVGMALLHGYDLRIQVIDGGSVTIEALN